MTLAESHQRALALAEHDPEIRGVWPSEDALRTLADSESCLQSLANACRLYADRFCLRGTRDLTFADLWQLVESTATGFGTAQVAAGGDRIGICGFGSVDWVVVDLACLHAGIVSVPVPAGVARPDLVGMINDVGMCGIAVSAGDLAAITTVLSACPTIRTLIVMDGGPAQSWRSSLERLPRAISVLTVDELAGLGRPTALEHPMARQGASDLEDLRTLVFTSGSGGRPKAAMFPERVWLEYWRDPARGGLPVLPAIRLASLPLAHIAGRRQLLYSLVTGGVTCFTSAGNSSALVADARRVRPTVMMVVPRLSNLIYQHFRSECLRRPGADREIMAEMRTSFLGDRLLLLITGSAPTAPDVAAFLPECFQVPVLRGYATTEAGVLTFDERPVANLMSFRLADVPALGYKTTDTPNPRGELLVRTRSMVPGYYNDHAASRDLFTEDGFMRTYDVVEQRGPTELVWRDRVEDVVKLTNGEFVEISRLESVYGAGSPFIRQIYIHGDPAGYALAAAVVPEMTVITAHVSQSSRDEAGVESLMAEELSRIARERDLRPHERPQAVMIVREAFAVDNGLLTESGKLARHRLKAAYGERLNELILQLPRSNSMAATTTTEAALHELMQPFLNSAWQTRSLPPNITLGPQGLGLDSMGLLEVLLACEAHFGVSLAAEDLRSDKGGEPMLSRLVEVIATRCSDGTRT